MYFGMRRSGLISFALHALLILACIIALPTAKIPQATDDEVSFEFVGPAKQQQSQFTGKTPAQNKGPVTHNAEKAIKQPDIKKPIVAPPPAPPPPPPTPNKPQIIPKPPSPAPPPPPRVQTPTLAPPPPPPPPKPQPKSTSTEAQPPLPLPPPPAPPVAAQSTLHQPHVVKTPDELSKEVQNTLQNLRAEQKQDKPPTSTYNPDADSAADAGGSKSAIANSHLSGADKNAIGAHVKPCFNVDAGAPGLDTFSVKILVQTDASGVIRNAVISPDDQDKLSDPIFNAYAQRAIGAVLNYQCSDLSSVLPANMLGQNETFLFNFSAQ